MIISIFIPFTHVLQEYLLFSNVAVVKPNNKRVEVNLDPFIFDYFKFQLTDHQNNFPEFMMPLGSIAFFKDFMTTY